MQPGSDHTRRASLPPVRKPRLAAGRARALGLPTRGTTNANRLRRADRWLVATQVPRLRDAARPLEIDPARVAAVAEHRDPPRVDFRVGGFELAGLRPVLVRAFNVLRQYDEESAARAWDTMRDGLAPGGVIVEGT